MPRPNFTDLLKQFRDAIENETDTAWLCSVIADLEILLDEANAKFSELGGESADMVFKELDI